MVTEMQKELFTKMFGGYLLNDVIKTLKKDLTKCKNKTDIARLLPKYLLYVYFERDIDTLTNTFYTFKTMLKEIGTNKALILRDMLKMDFAITKYRKNEYEKKQLEKLKDDSQNLNIDYIYRKTKELLENIEDDDYLSQYINTRQTLDDIKTYAKIAIVALYTGRRINEILNTLEIHKIKNKVFIKGLLKKKGLDDKDYELCLFEKIDIKLLQKFLRDIRKYLQVDLVKSQAKTITRQNQLLNKKYNAIINKNIRKIYNLKNLTIHDFRAIYAELCFQKSNEKLENKNEFIAKVLNHAMPVTQTAYKTKLKK